MEVVLIFVLLFVALAITGFVTVVRWLLSRFLPTRTQERTARSITEDAIATCHLINHLYSRNEIPAETFLQLRGILDEKYGASGDLPERFRSSQAVGEQGIPAAGSPVEPAYVDREVVRAVPVETTGSGTIGSGGDRPSGSTGREGEFQAADQLVQSSDQKSADNLEPWERPDRPLRPPRRSLRDLLATFMQEKNIRWGELASGILILGSAIGLVASLRHELTRTIPYFPALLFLLITAAIHGAGSYTLRKWKLRRTSRGTLVIGLLLVPLNFLSATLLTGGESLRRPLEDPLYWIAILTGLVAFGMMTWWSSRMLLKRGNWPVMAGIIGAAITTLLINRIDWPIGSSWPVLMVTAVLAASVFAGSGIFSKSIRKHRKWKERTLNRFAILLGLAIFAALNGAALIVIRTPDRVYAITAMMPLLIFVSGILSWSGLIVESGFRVSGSTAWRIVGVAMAISGGIIAVFALMSSVFNPAILMISGLVLALVTGVIVRDREISGLTPVAFSGVSIACLCGVNLLAGKTGLDERTGLQELQGFITNGHSGLALMACGLFLGGVSGQRFRLAGLNDGLSGRINTVTSMVIGSIGCLIAMAAGLMNRENQFDTMTASVLWGIASIISLRLMATQTRPALPHLFAVSTIGFLTFTLLWNPTTAGWFSGVASRIESRLLIAFAFYSLAMGGAASFIAMSSPGAGQSLEKLGIWCAVGILASFCLAIPVATSQSGLATILLFTTLFAAILVAWATREGADETGWPSMVMLAINATGLTGLIDYSSRLGIPMINQTEHWLLQAGFAGVWATLWTSSRRFPGAASRVWFFGDEITSHPVILVQGILFVGLVCLLVSSLIDANARQLIAGYAPVFFRAGEHMPLCAFAVGSLFVSLSSSFFLQPTRMRGMAVTAVWVLGWSLPALLFDPANSAGSATRWLLSMGCLITAIVIGVSRFWQHSAEVDRELTSLDSGRSVAHSMIVFFLVMASGIVIVISSATIARVMLSDSQIDVLGGPVAGSLFAKMPVEVSYGVPVGLITAAFMAFAILERRQWLATTGSMVYQYMVLFSIVLLYYSPHPKLATSWFLHIVQAVSAGMSAYGVIWFIFRERIQREGAGSAERSGFSPTQLETHVLLNALLVISLAVLIGWRFYFAPEQSGGWVNSAGGLMGVISLALVAVPGWMVLRDRYRGMELYGPMLMLFVVLGMASVSMIAANLDRFLATRWIGLRTIAWGNAGLLVAVWWGSVFAGRILSPAGGKLPWPLIWLPSLVALAFGIRGGLTDVSHVWQYSAVIFVVVGVATLAGIRERVPSAEWIATGGAVAVAVILRNANPSNWFSADRPEFINLVTALLCIIGTVWSIGSSRWVLKRRSLRFDAVLPTTILAASGLWILFAGVGQLWIDSFGGASRSASSLANPMGIIACVSAVVHAVFAVRNRLVAGWVASSYMISTGVAMTVASSVTAIWGGGAETIALWGNFSLALVILAWGIGWKNRRSWLRTEDVWFQSRLESIELGMKGQLPLFAIWMGLLILAVSQVAMFFCEQRPQRYLAAMTPFCLSFGIGCLSDQGGEESFRFWPWRLQPSDM